MKFEECIEKYLELIKENLGEAAGFSPVRVYEIKRIGSANENNFRVCCVSPCEGVDYYNDEGGLEYLKQCRREEVQYREEMLANLRECGKQGDKEGAKFFKDEQKASLKRERGMTIAVKYLEGDKAYVDPKDWPVELAFQIFRAFGLTTVWQYPNEEAR